MSQKRAKKNRRDDRAEKESVARPEGLGSPDGVTARVSPFLWVVPLLLAALFNLNVLQNGYGWDDETIIPKMKRPDSWAEIFLPSFEGDTQKAASSYFRPIISLSYQMDYMIWGPRPFGFHFSVWLAHLLNTCLVFFLARSLIQIEISSLKGHRGSISFLDSPRVTHNILPLIAASLFAVHPVHAEAVAWIAGRNDVYCASFLLASLLFYMRFHRTRSLHLFGLSMLAYLAALLTKEAALGFFLLFPLYEYWAEDTGPTRRPSPGNSDRKPLSESLSRLWRHSRFWFPVPMVILGFYLWMRASKIAEPFGDTGSSKLETVSPLWETVSAWAYYFKIMIVPYPHQPFVSNLPSSGLPVLFSLIAILIIVGIVFFSLFRREIVLGISLLWTLIILAPASLVVFLPLAVAPAAERYVYAPSAGFIIALTWLAYLGLKRLEKNQWRLEKKSPILVIVLIAGILLWGWESWRRNAVWRSPLSFWETAAAASPKAGFPHRELGYRYAQDNKDAEAEAAYQNAIRIDKIVIGPEHPEVAASMLNLGLLYTDQGKYSEAESLYKQAIAIFDKVLMPDSPDIATGLNNLAQLYFLQKKYEEAEPLFERSLAIREKILKSDDLVLANTLNRIGGLYYSQEKYGKARLSMERALNIWEKALGPEDLHVAQTLNNLGALFHAQGDYKKAESLVRRSLAIREKLLNPDHPDISRSLSSLAGIYFSRGLYGKAEPLFKRSLAIREKAFGPEHPTVAAVLDNYALLLYKTNQKTLAIRMKDRARKIRATQENK